MKAKALMRFHLVCFRRRLVISESTILCYFIINNGNCFQVVKILTKLRLLAQIKNAYHYRPEEENEDSEEVTVVNNTTSSVNITFEEPQVQKELETVPEDVEVVPVNTKISVSKVKSGKLKEEEPSRLSNLGVFFAELVGSIVGLTYGAVAQIASGGQNPVTISTSEGL